MVAVETSVPRKRLLETLATNGQLLEEEKVFSAGLVDRSEAARHVIAECDRAYEASMKRQMLLTNAMGLYESLISLTSPDAGEHVASEDVQPLAAVGEVDIPVARLGDQHYRMLAAIRAQGILSVEDIALHSGHSPRRIKNQMSSDLVKGFVILRGETYEITPRGMDVLSRFEDFRRSVGKKLPSPRNPLVDEDEDTDEDDARPSAMDGKPEVGDETHEPS